MDLSGQFYHPHVIFEKMGLQEIKTVESPGILRKMRILTRWASGRVCDAAFLSSPPGAMPVLRVLGRHSEKSL